VTIYFTLLAAAIVIVGVLAVYTNVGMGLFSRSIERGLFICNAIACLIITSYYFLDLLGVFTPGVSGAAIMRPMFFVVVCLFSANAIIHWPYTHE
jgi:hypothetical protein